MVDPGGSGGGGGEDEEQRNNTPPANRPNFSRIEFPKLTDTQSVEYWFIRIESWFGLQNINEESVRFQAVVASLTPQLFDQVVDLVVTPPAEEPYKKLKEAIIEKFADSEFTRVDKMLSTVPLGAQRPSHLLAEIRRAGATSDERILRVVWLRRLPVSIRAILSASKSPLSELAEMADASYDTIQNDNISQVASTSAACAPTASGSSTSATIVTRDELAKCIEALTLQINEMRKSKDQRPRGRSQNRNNDRQRDLSRHANQNRDRTPAGSRLPTCWYHRNFGTQAQKCQHPCDFHTRPQPPPDT